MNMRPAVSLQKALKVIEKPVRREILKRLSQEPAYPFQLAKEMGLSQPQVAKQLILIEAAGLVSSSMVSTSRGPDRRIYTLEKSLSIIIDVAPHLFKENIVSFDVGPRKEDLSGDSASFVERMGEIRGYPLSQDRIRPLAEVLSDVDEELERIEAERTVLLHIRNSVMQDASDIVQKLGDADARRVIHRAIDEHERSVEGISKSLNLRDDVVSDIVARIKKSIKTDYI
jgi:predicted transcriptional regulator